MKITVNGDEREVAPGTTVAQFIGGIHLLGSRVAVERNYEIIPRSRYEVTVLEEGDRLEVVTFVGGG